MYGSGDISRTRGLVDLLGAYGPRDSLGVRRPVGPLCSYGCRGVEPEDGGNASIKRRNSSRSSGPAGSSESGSVGSFLTPTGAASDFGSHIFLFPFFFGPRL